jgi:hypothetical protein
VNNHLDSVGPAEVGVLFTSVETVTHAASEWPLNWRRPMSLVFTTSESWARTGIEALDADEDSIRKWTLPSENDTPTDVGKTDSA